MASHSPPPPPPPSHHPPFSFRNLIKHAVSKLLHQFYQTNSVNRFQFITRFIHSIASSRRTFQQNTLPLYVVHEFQSHQIPITNRYTSFGEMNLSLTFQAAIGLVVSPQISPSRFLQIAKVMLVINYGVSFSGVFLRNSFPRFGNNLEKFGSVLTLFIFFLMAASFLPASFCWISWLVFALSMAAFLLSLFR